MEGLKEIKELLDVYMAKRSVTRINWLIDRELTGNANLDELQELNQLASLVLNQIDVVVKRTMRAK